MSLESDHRLRRGRLIGRRLASFGHCGSLQVQTVLFVLGNVPHYPPLGSLEALLLE